VHVAVPMKDANPLVVAAQVTDLTQYLIEHCCELLGDDALRLMGETNEDNSGSLMTATTPHSLVAVNPHLLRQK